MSASDRRSQRGPWFVLLAVLALGLPAGLLLGVRTELAPRAPVWTEPLRLTILHTNDLHGQVKPQEKSDERSGLLALGRRIRQERDEAQRAGRQVLLLDAGDIYQGTLEGDLTQGDVVIDWMNHVGYDAAEIGNHEFDKGVEAARRAISRAGFPVLGANIRSKLTGSVPAWLGGHDQGPLAGRAVVRELGPLKVAVIGVVTHDTPGITTEGATAGLEFLDEVETLKAVLDELPLCDLVVVLSHCGVGSDEEPGEDERIAKALAGRIDVIVGGHSHTRLPEGKRVAGVLIVQAGSRAQSLGRVDLEVTPGQPRQVEASARLLPAGDDLPGVLAPHLDRVREEASRPVGRLIEGISREGEDASALGNLITDQMREASQADLAFTNRGGIRGSLREGVLLFEDVYQVLPFANSLVTVQLTGAQVLEALQTSISGRAGSRLEVSGAEVIYARRAEGKHEVLQVTVGGQPLDPARTYTVALNDFLADGKDGYPVFKQGKARRSTGRPLRALLLSFLSSHSPYAPAPLDPRIRALDGD